MGDAVTIWIVEDVDDDALDAWAAVETLRGSWSTPVRVCWTPSFHWYPPLRMGVGDHAPLEEISHYPDIVILDLCLRTPKGEELRGDVMYQKLREWETHKTCGGPAFVIFWSLHQGRKDTDRFVRHIVESDARVIPLASKRPELLKETLANLWRRVIEEREK